MEGLVLFALVGLGVWHFWGKRHFRSSRANNALANLPGFSGAYFLSDANGESVAIDPIRKKLAFVDKTGRTALAEFKDIVDVQVCKNGAIVTTTNRVSQLVSAAIGHFLFAQPGFVVGGTTASTTTSEALFFLSLKIYLKNIAEPFKEVVIYRGPTIKLTSKKGRTSVALLEEWHGRFRAAMASP